jgi:hypothetical protein
MSETVDEIDIVDRIASALPAEIRAAYYRELTHCRSLPENDEMLRILRAMQFLTLLMQQVPERVLLERERLEQLFGGALERLHSVVEDGGTYHKLLEQRLAGLPAELAERLDPETVAREINENLRQQFVQSTIPQTADALAVVAKQLRSSVADFGKTAGTLGDSYRGAVDDARRAIADLETTVSRATATARRAAAELSSVSQKEFRWSLYALTSLALVIGLAVGSLYQRWLDNLPQAPAPIDSPEKPPSPKAKAKTIHGE